MNDEANIFIDPDRPKILVLNTIQFVKTHSWICRIHLQVKSSSFNLFLLTPSQFGKAGSKRICNSEVHLPPTGYCVNILLDIFRSQPMSLGVCQRRCRV